LFYEGVNATNPASRDQCIAVLEAIAIRVRGVEVNVPVPPGMGTLPPSTTPM